MRQRTELSTVGRHDPVPQETVKQPEGSHQKQICRNVIQAGVLCKMKDGRTPITRAYCAAEADAYLHCIQKGIHFPSNDYNKTRPVLFICLKAQMICIDSLFIYCWTQHRINERKQNGFQLQQVMPFLWAQYDEGLKLGGKEQSKTTYCLLWIQKQEWKTFHAETRGDSLGTSDTVSQPYKLTIRAASLPIWPYTLFMKVQNDKYEINICQIQIKCDWVLPGSTTRDLESVSPPTYLLQSRYVCHQNICDQSINATE